MDNILNISILKRLMYEAISQLHDEQQVFTKAEAAAFLKIKESALERYAFKLNQIAYSKAGKNAVFLREDLLKFLAKRRIPSIYDEGV